MPNPLRSFLALPPEKRQVVTATMMELPRTAYILRRSGFAPARDRALQTPPVPGLVATGFNEYRVANLFGIGVRRAPFKGKCLTQSLVLLRLLTQYGLHGRLEIGAQYDDGQLKAHAWVEDGQGHPLNDRGDISDVYQRFGLEDHKRGELND